MRLLKFAAAMVLVYLFAVGFLSLGCARVVPSSGLLPVQVQEP